MNKILAVLALFVASSILAGCANLKFHREYDRTETVTRKPCGSCDTHVHETLDETGTRGGNSYCEYPVYESYGVVDYGGYVDYGRGSAVHVGRGNDHLHFDGPEKSFRPVIVEGVRGERYVGSHHR